MINLPDFSLMNSLYSPFAWLFLGCLFCFHCIQTFFTVFIKQNYQQNLFRRRSFEVIDTEVISLEAEDLSGFFDCSIPLTPSWSSRCNNTSDAKSVKINKPCTR